MNTTVAKEGQKVRWIAANLVTTAMRRNMNLYRFQEDIIRIQNKSFTEIHLKPHEYEIVEEETA